MEALALSTDLSECNGKLAPIENATKMDAFRQPNIEQ